MDTYADRQANALLSLQAAIQRAHSLDQLQSCMDRAVGVVFMRLGITKVDQQAIPEILRDMAVKALNDFGTGGLIGPHDLPQVFRVESTGQRRRVHQITEQHGELAAFGLRGVRYVRWGSNLSGLI